MTQYVHTLCYDHLNQQNYYYTSHLQRYTPEDLMNFMYNDNDSQFTALHEYIVSKEYRLQHQEGQSREIMGTAETGDLVPQN